MSDEHGIAFQKFLIDRRKDLQRIARSTRGEYEPADVQNEAWLMIHVIRNTKDTQFDISNRPHQDLLISYLYQYFVRYTEKTVRHAEKLDHWNGSTDESFTSHPLLRKLAADAESDPLNEWLERESVSRRPTETLDRHSLAGAYIDLLRRFDNKMRAVADYLLISISYCYKRYSVALQLTRSQRPFPNAGTDDKNFSPRAWRSFRIWTAPQQLVLDFGDEPTLFDDYHVPQ
jgi:hypothetical protein